MYIHRKYAAAFAALVLLLAPCSLLHAATKTWTGNAADLRQISTITVANTWATADTATITINGKALVVTIGTNVTTAQVATAIKEAFNAGSRLDGTASTDATSNAGGQEFGEFAEAVASVSGSVVTIIANEPGVPITITATETTAGSGTATGATAQTATGKNFWSNANNWDTGTVPANNDVVVFRDSNVSCKFGLPNGSLEVTIQTHQTFTGEIGLPPTNVDNAAKPYPEYRQRYVRLDDAGSGSDIAHRFGIGQQGAGSPLVNIRHSTVKCSPIVFNTGQPLPSRPGTYALNICGSESTSTINILNGSVDFGSQDGGTSAWATAKHVAGVSRCLTGIAVLHHVGGQMVIGQSGGIIYLGVSGGTLRVENQTGTITQLDIFAGTVEYPSTAQITTLNVYAAGGTFDARENAGNFAIGAAEIYLGGGYIDPHGRGSCAATFYVRYEPSDRLQFGASAGAGILIVLP